MISILYEVIRCSLMVCLQVMDRDLFTDLLSAAMSESGLIDLETYDDQPVADSGSLLAANAQSAMGTPTSQALMSVSVQQPQIQTSSIVLQHSRLQTPLPSAVIANSANAAKGVHKIVLRPLPTGLQQSISSRPLQPVVLQSTRNHQPHIPPNVTSGQTPVRSVLPVLQTTVPTSSITIRSQTAPSVSTVSISGTTVRPAMISKTLRFTAVPRHPAGRLPTGETNVSLHIRPRLSASVIVPQVAASTTGNTVQPPPKLSQACTPLTTSNCVPSNLFTTAAMSVSSLSASVSQPVASKAADHVNSVADIVATASCVSSVSALTGMQITTLCLNADSGNRLSVTSASSDGEFSLVQSDMLSQADTHIDSCSTVVTSELLSSDPMARCIYTSSTVTVSSSSVVSSGSVHIATSSEQPDDVGSTLTLSENMTVTEATNHNAAEAKCDPSTVNHSAAEDDDQQVRNESGHCLTYEVLSLGATKQNSLSISFMFSAFPMQYCLYCLVCRFAYSPADATHSLLLQ